MLTVEELDFLYQMLDQISVRGESQKLMVLTIMQKLRVMTEENGDDKPENSS